MFMYHISMFLIGELLSPSNSFSNKLQIPLVNPSNSLSNEIQILDTRTYEWIDSIRYVKKSVLTKRGPKNEPSNPFFTIPRYIRAIIYCAAGFIIITAIILTYYSIKQKYKTRSENDILNHK